MRSLQSEFVCEAYEFYEDEHRVYLVIEYINGLPLNAFMA